ncbi:MAG: cation-translocating P-type ATPase, partial [Gammaproteobacteria bacterium]
NKRLHVRWDNSQIKLSAIIKRLGDIGYAAVPFDPESAEGIIRKQNRSLLLRMAFAAFAMMNLMWISIALYSGADEGEFRSMFHWIGFVLATPTLLYSGWPFYKGAWTGLRQMHLTMDLPIAIGASVTYLYSCYVMITGSQIGEVYFDTVVNFMFVILVGRFLEAKSKRHAVAATQRLLDLQPRVATLIKDGESRIVPIRTIKPGDIVLVKAGDKIPVDGLILEGESAIDESMLSGESVAVTKRMHDSVSAGTINTESAITVEVVATLRNTALGRIIHLVEEAQASKAPIQCTADKIVPWFVAATLLLATLTFFWWVESDFETALMAATAVMIITCPCAFGMATPMAIAVASGLGARYGILVKNGTVLEYLSAINHVVFDKTGTLTRGKMQLQKIYSRDFNENELLHLIARAEQFSEHSIAKAIVEKAKDSGLSINTNDVSDFRSKSGYGIHARVDNHQIIIGTYDWLQQHDVKPDLDLLERSNALQKQGVSCVHVAIDKKDIGLVAMSDQLRDDAKLLVNALRQAGIKMTLLSGDRKMVAEAVADELGGMNVIAEVLPDEKEQVIRQLQSAGEKVAMVGDGVNDAPALIRADVGIAVGSGTDVSMESADIVLLSNELDKVRLAMMLSRRTLKTIRQNIGISFLYNIIMVPLAMMTYVTPLVAAISMPVSSLAVIGNAARIRTLFSNKAKY